MCNLAPSSVLAVQWTKTEFTFLVAGMVVMECKQIGAISDVNCREHTKSYGDRKWLGVGGGSLN